MGLFDKVKNFFYDEEYEEEIETPIKEEKKHKKEKIKIIEKKEKPKLKKEKEEEISERELFKAERTFNFPMDIEEEDEFTSIKIKKEEKPIIVEEKKVIPKPKEEKAPAYTGIRTYAKKEEVKEEEEKKFTPSPVISPIYGILDKNYKKEDLVIDSVKEDKEQTTKVDYDSVRKKAYSDIYEEKEEDNNIFYNLDSKEDDKEENSDVKIIYNDVSLDEEEDKNATIGQKIEEYERKQKEEKEEDEDFEIDDDSQILSETKEQDLFNLIDNMYNSDEEDEEEE